VTIKIIKNTTLGGTPAYTNISTNDSIVEYDTAGTTITGGVIFFSFNMGKEDTRIIDIENLKEFIEANETITVAANSGGGTNPDVFASINWIED
jgi:hypothetical protein